MAEGIIESESFSNHIENLKKRVRDGQRLGGFMSRTRMLYWIGGESLNDIKKSERYKAPPINLIPDEPTDEPYYPE